MTQARDLADGKFDTNTLVVDAANNRVGVGTASPTAELHVGDGSGSSDNTRLRILGGTSGYSTIQLGDSNSANIGQLQYDHSSNFLAVRVNAAERARFLSGGGLTFNGDTAAANALDDYEEGTYTPQISATDGIGTLAYSTQVGTYTKIGNTVTFQLFIQVSSKGTVAGTIRLTLPFTAANVTNAFQSAAVRNDNVTGGSFSGNEQGGRIHANENIIRLDVIGSGTRSNFTAGNLLNNTNFIVSGSYRVN